MNMQNAELKRIKQTVATAWRSDNKLLINAGHGLTRDNVNAIAQIEGVYELNIGHTLIADAVFVGLEQAVIMMKEAIYTDLQSYQKISLVIYVSGNLYH